MGIESRSQRNLKKLDAVLGLRAFGFPDKSLIYKYSDTHTKPGRAKNLNKKAPI
jgi:hypothetical protein